MAGRLRSALLTLGDDAATAQLKLEALNGKPSPRSIEKETAAGISRTQR
jgi:hypothetical protein